MTEFHKRSGKTRKRQQQQIEKHFTQRRRPEDHKRLKEQARRRKAEQRRGPRRRDWSEQDEDAATFERMGRRPEEGGAAPGGQGGSGAGAARGRPDTAAPSVPPRHTAPSDVASHDALAEGRSAPDTAAPASADGGEGARDTAADDMAARRTGPPDLARACPPGDPTPPSDAAAADTATDETAAADTARPLGDTTSPADAALPDIAPPDVRGLAVARLIGLSRGAARLATHEGGERDAVLGAGLAEVQQTALAVGDLVRWQEAAGTARVLEVLPRRSELCRPDPGNPHRRRVLAANVDVAVLVVSVRRPRLRAGLIDRFLVALEGSGAAPVVVLNKVDLLGDDGAERATLEQLLDPFRRLGVPCLTASAASGEGLDELARLLAGRASVFVGHSGVGKSSLLNGLDPDGRRRVHAGRDGDGKGRHTTTASSLTELPGGTLVIDTPGVRAFGLWELDRAGLRLAFPEFVAVHDGCRFRDCSHLVEPDCAVRAAVGEGVIPQTRWQAYVRIHASLDE